MTCFVRNNKKNRKSSIKMDFKHTFSGNISILFQISVCCDCLRLKQSHFHALCDWEKLYFFARCRAYNDIWTLNFERTYFRVCVLFTNHLSSIPPAAFGWDKKKIYVYYVKKIEITQYGKTEAKIQSTMWRNVHRKKKILNGTTYEMCIVKIRSKCDTQSHAI